MKWNYDKYPYKAQLERKIFEYLYQEATRDQATYLQALVLASGNETIAKAKYFELRFAQIIESDDVIQYAKEIDAENGECCFICYKPKRKKEYVCILKKSKTWAHSDCLVALKRRNKVQLEKIYQPNPRECYFCFRPTRYREVTLFDLGLKLNIHYACHDYYKQYAKVIGSEKSCNICGKKFRLFSNNSWVWHYNIDAGYFRFKCHNECVKLAMAETIDSITISQK